LIKLDKRKDRYLSFRLGGKVRLIFSGSAPIETEVLDYLKVCFCCPIIEAYGTTEATGVAFITTDTDPVASGTIGGPLGCIEAKIVDVPELKYFTNDVKPTGEVV
jgi:long-chain acyl-CoA synthetase